MHAARLEVVIPSLLTGHLRKQRSSFEHPGWLYISAIQQSQPVVTSCCTLGYHVCPIIIIYLWYLPGLLAVHVSDYRMPARRVPTLESGGGLGNVGAVANRWRELIRGGSSELLEVRTS